MEKNINLKKPVRIWQPKRGCRIMNKISPKHTSKFVQKNLQNKQINVSCWPSQILDLNPVENLWKELKKYKSKKEKKKNKSAIFYAHDKW